MTTRLVRCIKTWARLYSIIKTFLTYGLDEWLSSKYFPVWVRSLRFCFFWLRNRHSEKDIAIRFTLALQALGPVFVKFGQMLSTRRDLMPAHIADALTALQDQVNPFPSEQATSIVVDALALESLDDIFSHFDNHPLASASIAQVHAAKLKSEDKDVVVKVLRPGIRKVIDADIGVLMLIAELAQRYLRDGKRLRPVEVVKEYERTIVGELDLLREAANGARLRRNFEHSEALYVPYIYTDYCRPNVMVMERIKGIPVANVKALEAQATNMKLLAERGVEVFFTQVFRDSFFHADMHPGNIFVSYEHPQNPQYIAIDFGIVGTLNSEDKRYLAENFVAFFNRDYRKVAQLHADSGWVPRETNIDEFELAIRAVCDPIFQKPLAEISFGQVLLQLFNTARRFDMIVQPQLVLLQKTLLYIEGLGRQLYPQLDLWQTAKPFLEKWMKEQIGLKVFFAEISKHAPYWSEKLPEMPELLYSTLRQLKNFPAQQAAAQQQNLTAIHRHTQAHRLALLGVMLMFTFFASVLVGESNWLYKAMGVGGAWFYWKSGRLKLSDGSYK